MVHLTPLRGKGGVKPGVTGFSLGRRLIDVTRCGSGIVIVKSRAGKARSSSIHVPGICEGAHFPAGNHALQSRIILNNCAEINMYMHSFIIHAKKTVEVCLS